MSTAGGARRPARRPEGRPPSGRAAPDSLLERWKALPLARRQGLMRLAGVVGGLLVLLLVVVLLVGGGGEEEDPREVVYQDAADTTGPLDILAAQMDQEGPELVLNLRTGGIWTPGQIIEERGRSVCTTLFAGDARFPRSRVCITRRNGTPGLVLQRLGAEGRVLSSRPIPGELRRRNLRLLEARFSFKAAGIPLGRFRWQVSTSWAAGAGCPPGPEVSDACRDQLPDEGTSAGQVTKPLLLGCTFTGPRQVLSGPRTQKVVALTFDDGPTKEYTTPILDILRRERVPASFFVVGEMVAENPAVLRRVQDEGHTIANHTYTHMNIAGAGPEAARELDRTTAEIRKVTEFTPCLFRPPFGGRSPQSTALVARKGMQSVIWDVDTSDYQGPSAPTITQNVLQNARNGSIVLMHDGGGPREQTVQALPQIIKGLRAKGFRFVTLDQLLRVKGRYA